MPGVPGSGDGGLGAADTRLRELLAERDAQIAEQAAEIAVLREALAGLQSQVADLAAQLKTNSRNSGKPPSSDGPANPAPKSLRGKSGRRPGRPKGQPGATMELTEHPDKKVRHRPGKCGGCGKSLKNAPVTAVERRQVIDIPPVKTVTTEHQMLTVRCGCGCETKAPAPDGVRAGAVRAADHGHRDLPAARPVPVPRPRPLCQMAAVRAKMRARTPSSVRPPYPSRSSCALRVWLTDSMTWRSGLNSCLPALGASPLRTGRGSTRSPSVIAFSKSRPK
jgi:uncharacterized protein DUF6444/transposase IS66-like protein